MRNPLPATLTCVGNTTDGANVERKADASRGVWKVAKV